jgi:hypothetical protein
MDGFEVPLAAWRVRATAAELSERRADMGAPEDPLRETFLSASSISKVLAGSGLSPQASRTS